MNRTEIARLHRTLRHRLRLTQSALAARARIGRWIVGRIEAGDLDRLRLGDVEASFDALGARVVLRALYRGAAAERLLDEGHAALVGGFVALLQRYGWQVRVEHSFSEFGERGSIDILAWHAPARVLLVVEVKSQLAGLDATLRPLDVKVRLAPVLAARALGWRARHVARILVLPENSAARRAVARHATTFDAALPARSRELRRWLRNPDEPVAGIWFLSSAQTANRIRNASAVQRVRLARSRSPQLRRPVSRG